MRQYRRRWLHGAIAPAPATPVVYPDDTRKLCLSSGRTFAATGALAELHAKLDSLAAHDTTLDVVPLSSLHFSFLALSWGLYDEPYEAPTTLGEVARMLDEHASRAPFIIRQLRVVPLRNSLILAGVPDAITFDARAAFTRAMLTSPWRKPIEARYRGYEIPPAFWHTTLVRANTQFAPQALREVYEAFQFRAFDNLALGAPQFVLANYNWARRHIISSLSTD